MEDNARKRANYSSSLSIALSLSFFTERGERDKGKGRGGGENPWPLAWFETGGSFVGIKAACLSFEFLISILFLRRGKEGNPR